MCASDGGGCGCCGRGDHGRLADGVGREKIDEDMMQRSHRREGKQELHLGEVEGKIERQEQDGGEEELGVHDGRAAA